MYLGVLRANYVVAAGFCCAALSVFSSLTSAEPDRGKAIQFLTQAAIAWPDNSAIFEAYLSVLPKDSDGNYYVEGDLMKSREDVLAYLKDFNRVETTRTVKGTKIKVALNPVTKAPLFWKAGERRLTYSIDRASFGPDGVQRASETLDLLNGAVSDWIAACPRCDLRIEFVKPENAGPRFERVTFVLAYDSNPLGPIARAFFPYQQTNQRVLVFPKFFRPNLSVDLRGVLRHELGHVLGYRHEHINGVPGCDREDNNWTRITPDTPKSVMHYICGGRGDTHLTLKPLDIAGHRCVYEFGLDTTRCNKAIEAARSLP